MLGIKSHYVTAREARQIARMLKSNGYKGATIENCRGYISNLVNNFQPYGGHSAIELEKAIGYEIGLLPEIIDQFPGEKI